MASIALRHDEFTVHCFIQYNSALLFALAYRKLCLRPALGFWQGMEYNPVYKLCYASNHCTNQGHNRKLRTHQEVPSSPGGEAHACFSMCMVLLKKSGTQAGRLDRSAPIQMADLEESPHFKTSSLCGTRPNCARVGQF